MSGNVLERKKKLQLLNKTSDNNSLAISHDWINKVDNFQRVSGNFYCEFIIVESD